MAVALCAHPIMCCLLPRMHCLMNTCSQNATRRSNVVILGCMNLRHKQTSHPFLWMTMTNHHVIDPNHFLIKGRARSVTMLLRSDLAAAALNHCIHLQMISHLLGNQVVCRIFLYTQGMSMESSRNPQTSFERLKSRDLGKRLSVNV